mmetsp:Transcript_1592/g.2056  ORF Transcript_1592/g.2056 Transcript_1592/m.2056 type:complete len:296 (+) Transcript_1592:237-1124(+)
MEAKESAATSTKDEATKRHHKLLARIHGHVHGNPWIRVEAFLWKEVGGMYPYLDIPSGLCFVLGSFAFTLAPLLRMVLSADADYGLDWLLMAGVILFTAAKALVELRAGYAHLFKGPSARVSGCYHAAVVGLLIGGLLFGAYLLLVVQPTAGPLLLARFSLSSSVFFFLGSAAFVADAYPQAHSDGFRHDLSNSYLLGSLLFLLGSAFFIAGSSLSFPNVPSRETPENGLSLLGGAMFLLGSCFFLFLGFLEMREFKRGPDMNLPSVRRRCKQLGIDPDPANNPHFEEADKNSVH